MKKLWSRNAAFTLLELLAVMAIMVLLMSMSVGAYYGFVRGASLKSSVLSVKTTLQMAKQYAVTHRCRTVVLFWQDSTNSHYVVCAQEGTQQGISGTKLVSNDANWPALTDQEIYNLSTGKRGLVKAGNVATELYSTNLSGVYVQWNSGDRYGWAIRSQQHFPEGIGFGDGQPSSAPPSITFNSDGTVPLPDVEIELAEIFEPVGSRASSKIHVAGLTGRVKVE